ncbi:LETM1 domain-containing protein 1-like [Babylonia areolata]|uniref:LETM1 domain-containing protein 1-like n=1 Tax=Babylonia areolata TaxID=304850 RepID=UPI003FD4E746
MYIFSVSFGFYQTKMATSLNSGRVLSIAFRDLGLATKLSNGCRSCSRRAGDKVQPPGFIKRLLVDRVITIVNNSTNRLEKAYPTVFQIYKTFKTGLSGFVQDSREYYNVSTEVWSGHSLRDLSRKELEILRQVPRDFVKIIPVLLVSLVPGGSGAFPIAYVFPRLLLSHHFWTEQQRHEFWQKELKHRLEHLQPILDNMQLMSRHIDDPDMECKVLNIVRKLQHSVHPTVTDILVVKPLFESYPYNLERLSIAYVRHLGKLMRMSLRRRWLRHDAMLLHYTDMAMAREGIENMNDFELERACFWRGLNPVGLQRHERISFLHHWTAISQTVDEHSASLLLHLPLLLAFCQPTNRDLMGGWRYRFRIHRPS